MRRDAMRWNRVLVAALCLFAPVLSAMADTSAALVYETVEPPLIRLGESATIRVTSFDGHLKDVAIPSVAGLTFELIGHSQGIEFVNGTAIPATYVLIRVTPQFAGVFSIPGLTPNSHSIGLQVIGNNEPDPLAWHSQKPAPLPVKPVSLPKGIQLKAGGAAFVQVVIPTRAVYVGESVPVEIELGVRPGIVTSMNGLPTLNGSDFTLDNLSKQPERREQNIEGSPFVVMVWHSVLAAVKPGDFALSVETPISVKINTLSAADNAFAATLAWPFSQSAYNGIAPKDITIASPAAEMKVLPLPTQGQPKDFSGAVGDFQVSSDVSPASPAAGDPLTLRLHISGVGNFDRVDAKMFDHLDHWKTYPAKSSFTPSDAVGYHGEKIFEQPLIAAQPGEQIIPELGFSYFNPNTRRYERAQTSAIRVMIAASRADAAASALAANRTGTPGDIAHGLRPDHHRPQRSVAELRPLYFRPPFLALPATIALILAGSWLAMRPDRARATSKAAERALAQLGAAARADDPSSFFEAARNTLLQTFSARWGLPPDEIGAADLKSRLGTMSEDIERLFELADEAKYSAYDTGGTDFQRWLRIIREQIVAEGK